MGWNDYQGYLKRGKEVAPKKKKNDKYVKKGVGTVPPSLLWGH